ncbi:Pol Polyprotein [Phytophthora megakarya]|uniref:Pol Polyprotein n=1 Tax=Phytophthora megakarya TaxID=4795 RepID=A0A225VBL7_9STRA|nr:Pol Polyprotein [Phytophthora megakarya]
MMWLNLNSVIFAPNDKSSVSEDDDRKVRDLGMVLKEDSFTTHMCADKYAFSSNKKPKVMFKVWTGEITVMSGVVTVIAANGFETSRNDETVELTLEDVEYSTAGTVNLMSLGRMETTGWVPSFSPSSVSTRKIGMDDGNQRLKFEKQGDHYWLSTLPTTCDHFILQTHERLDRLNVTVIKSMKDKAVVTCMEIPPEAFKQKFTCLTCVSAKRKRMSYKASAADKLNKINYKSLISDVCDMGRYLPGVSNYRYFQLIQDEGSRYKWVYPLKHKDESSANLLNLMSELLAQGHKIKRFTSNGSGEFVYKDLESFLNLHGIKFIPTHLYTPEENSLIEKLNGVLVGKMRAAILATDLPQKLWPEVLQYFVDIDNMSAT